MSKKKNIGIEIVRILSMYMVMILHILGHGGILKSENIYSFSFISIWFIEIISIVAVNLFGLISG